MMFGNKDMMIRCEDGCIGSLVFVELEETLTLCDRSRRTAANFKSKSLGRMDKTNGKME